MALSFYDTLQDTVNKLWLNVPTIRATTPPQVEIDESMPILTPQTQNLTLPEIKSATVGLNGIEIAGGDMGLTLGSGPSDLSLARVQTASAMTQAQNAGIPDTLSANIQALQNTINTQKAEIRAIEDERLKKAARQNAFSAATRIASTIAGGLEMNDYMDEVKATKEQYEVQKQIIDTNIANSETLLMERYRENMADLDVLAASKNIDPTSSAIQGMKEKGAMDMGKDFAIARTNAELQKLALDLDYARSNRIAAQNARNYWDNAAWDVAKVGIQYFIGG